MTTELALFEEITMSSAEPVKAVDVHRLASAVRNRQHKVLLLDCRSFIEHNACHISSAVNVCCSKIAKRRLDQDKVSVQELLIPACHHTKIAETNDVVVYDQRSKDVESLPQESFILTLLKKLPVVFQNVYILEGGFVEFKKFYPDLCEDNTKKCPPVTSLSQPCLPIANQGPTRILPFLYLGSQFDAINQDLLKDHNITYELNVSTSCPQPEFLPESRFMRIPVDDTYTDKLLPYFSKAFNFLDKVREGNSCVLVHCLAGISRSPTIAIAYVMRYLHLSSDEGYRYVKSKRPTISPNFNFLGQLLEYEHLLQQEKIDAKPPPTACSQKRQCRTDMRTLSLDIRPNFTQSSTSDHSPTTALAKLSFGGPCSDRVRRSKSCYGDWLRESSVERKENKILSPVKEIKCDGLISEISTSQNVSSRLSSSYDADKSLSQNFNKNRRVCCQTKNIIENKPPILTGSKYNLKYRHNSLSNLQNKKASCILIDNSTDLGQKQDTAHVELPKFNPVSAVNKELDSTSTSDFGTGDSNRFLKEQNLCKRMDQNVSCEETTATVHKKEGSSQLFLPLSFSKHKDWTESSSLSQSYGHLLEETCKSEPSSPCPTYFKETLNFETQACSPKKRGANFDAVNPNEWPTKDKRKRPESNPFESSFNSVYNLCANRYNLYRVQSCPGTLSNASHCISPSFDPTYSFPSAITYESCPDVLFLTESQVQSQKQKDFRRNVRCIQVS